VIGLQVPDRRLHRRPSSMGTTPGLTYAMCSRGCPITWTAVSTNGCSIAGSRRRAGRPRAA